MAEWQRIETAPKDGTPVLLCERPHDWIGVGKYVGGAVPWLLAEGFRVRATHFMPLPLEAPLDDA